MEPSGQGMSASSPAMNNSVDSKINNVGNASNDRKEKPKKATDSGYQSVPQHHRGGGGRSGLFHEKILLN